MTGATRVPTWSNWSGRHATTEATVHHVRSEDDAAALAADAARRGQVVRVAGAGHSHMPLVPTDGTIADLSGLSGVIDTDEARRQARVWAGTPIYALGRSLHDRGLALPNQGDIDRQLIGGAIATGTHGTGQTLANLSAAVVGARLATADGDLLDCSARDEAELWQACRHNLGALGIVTQIELQVREAYRLRETGELATFEQLAPKLEQHAAANRHFEFFWLPIKDEAAIKFINETSDEPEYPIGDEGSRVGWNYEVLPSHRTWPHTEMEYSVPAEQGPAALSAIRDLLAADFPDMGWPVEYRTLAADDVWLSTAYQRPTVTISLHQGLGVDDAPMFRAAEEVFRSFDGRPHWGKVNYIDGDELASIHPRWEDWWRVRDQHDPDQTFLNDYLRSIRP